MSYLKKRECRMIEIVNQHVDANTRNSKINYFMYISEIFYNANKTMNLNYD